MVKLQASRRNLTILSGVAGVTVLLAVIIPTSILLTRTKCTDLLPWISKAQQNAGGPNSLTFQFLKEVYEPATMWTGFNMNHLMVKDIAKVPDDFKSKSNNSAACFIEHMKQLKSVCPACILEMESHGMDEESMDKKRMAMHKCEKIEDVIKAAEGKEGIEAFEAINSAFREKTNWYGLRPEHLLIQDVRGVPEEFATKSNLENICFVIFAGRIRRRCPSCSNLAVPAEETPQTVSKFVVPSFCSSLDKISSALSYNTQGEARFNEIKSAFNSVVPWESLTIDFLKSYKPGDDVPEDYKSHESSHCFHYHMKKLLMHCRSCFAPPKYELSGTGKIDNSTERFNTIRDEFQKLTHWDGLKEHHLNAMTLDHVPIGYIRSKTTTADFFIRFMRDAKKQYDCPTDPRVIPLPRRADTKEKALYHIRDNYSNPNHFSISPAVMLTWKKYEDIPSDFVSTPFTSGCILEQMKMVRDKYEELPTDVEHELKEKNIRCVQTLDRNTGEAIYPRLNNQGNIICDPINPRCEELKKDDVTKKAGKFGDKYCYKNLIGEPILRKNLPQCLYAVHDGKSLNHPCRENLDGKNILVCNEVIVATVGARPKITRQNIPETAECKQCGLSSDQDKSCYLTTGENLEEYEHFLIYDPNRPSEPIIL